MTASRATAAARASQTKPSRRHALVQQNGNGERYILRGVLGPLLHPALLKCHLAVSGNKASVRWAAVGGVVAGIVAPGSG
eukprot:14127880-Alexandrium_andersonii.AAC.1